MSTVLEDGRVQPYPLELEMFAEQRQRLAASMQAQLPNGGKGAVALLRGGSEVPRNSSDTCYTFRQESYFQYLFGHEAPDYYGAVFADGSGVLLLPRLPESYGVWMGPLPSAEHIVRRTAIDSACFVDELPALLQARAVSTVHVMAGTNDDSGLAVLAPAPEVLGSLQGVTTDSTWLFVALTAQRVIKTPREQRLLLWANKISSDAHIKVLRMCKPGLSQHHLEATFCHHCFFHGAMRQMSYSCICATGGDGAVLHYVDNNRVVVDGGMALLDMGGEYHCYATDITCSFPVNGKFSADQKALYDAVLAAQVAVLAAMAPGVSWVDMHLLSHRTIAAHLLNLGFFAAGVTVEQIMEKEIMRLFQPHGLGHLIGMDVHDVGGYLSGTPARPTRTDACKLRTARVLEAGMFITVEPGLYFNKILLEEAFATPAVAALLNEGRLREFMTFGGIRIEDDVMVTADGVLNYTCCPRTTEEIERTMAGEAFHKEPTAYVNTK